MVSKDGGDVVAGTRLVWNQIGQSFSAPDRLHLRPYRAGIYVLAIAGSGAVVPHSAALTAAMGQHADQHRSFGRRLEAFTGPDDESATGGDDVHKPLRAAEHNDPIVAEPATWALRRHEQ